MLYTPDRWVIIHIKGESDQVCKVLATWYGGYLGGDSWKLSSGNLSVKDCGDYYEIPQHSGSSYHLYKGREGMGGIAASQLARFRNVPGLEITIIESNDTKDWVV